MSDWRSADSLSPGQSREAGLLDRRSTSEPLACRLNRRFPSHQPPYRFSSLLIPPCTRFFTMSPPFALPRRTRASPTRLSRLCPYPLPLHLSRLSPCRLVLAIATSVSPHIHSSRSPKHLRGLRSGLLRLRPRFAKVYGLACAASLATVSLDTNDGDKANETAEKLSRLLRRRSAFGSMHALKMGTSLSPPRFSPSFSSLVLA